MMELVFEHKPTRIVLIAGDGDFMEAVKTATRHKIEVVIAGYRDRSVSSDLQSEAQVRTLAPSLRLLRRVVSVVHFDREWCGWTRTGAAWCARAPLAPGKRSPRPRS